MKAKATCAILVFAGIFAYCDSVQGQPVQSCQLYINGSATTNTLFANFSGPTIHAGVTGGGTYEMRLVVEQKVNGVWTYIYDVTNPSTSAMSHAHLSGPTKTDHRAGMDYRVTGGAWIGFVYTQTYQFF